MNNDFDPIEQELKRLRPAAVSDELRERLTSPPPMRPRRWAIAALLAATAAGLLIAVALRPRTASRPVDFPAPSDLPVAHSRQIPEPTLRVYQQAALISHEALEELLDEHARSLPAIAAKAETAGQWN